MIGRGSHFLRFEPPDIVAVERVTLRTPQPASNLASREDWEARLIALNDL